MTDYDFTSDYERSMAELGQYTPLFIPLTSDAIAATYARNIAIAAAEARRLGDLWTRDAVWAGDRGTRLRDFRVDNCCEGAAGCQAMHCLFQMWKVGGLSCDAETFANFILQMDRFALAQEELKTMLQAPIVRNLLPRLMFGGNILSEIAAMQAIGNGNTVANDRITSQPDAWAQWITRAMALIAVVRWSLNLRWTLVKSGDASLWSNERALLQRFYQLVPVTLDDGSTIQGPADRDHETIVETWRTNEACDYTLGIPKGSTRITEWEGSWWGRYNYPGPRIRGIATPSLVRLSDNAVLYGQSGSHGPIGVCDVGERAWLRDRPLFNAVKVPVTERDFWPMFDVALPGQRTMIDAGAAGFYSPHWEQGRFAWPSWIGAGTVQPLMGGDTVQTALSKYFTAWARAARSTSPPPELQRQMMGQALSVYRTERGVKVGYPSPFMQVLCALAMAQDVVDHSAGDFVSAATVGWTLAYETLPESFRALTPAQMLEINRSVTAANVNTAAGIYGAAAGSVTAIVAAINPIAGAIVGAVLALVGLLIAFALEACIERPGSPPCISSPFLRYIESNSVPDSPCDSRTTEAGGAAAIEIKTMVFGAAAARGFTPAQIFDSVNTEADAGVDGAGQPSSNPDDPAQQGISTMTLVVGGAAAIGGLLLLANAMKKRRELSEYEEEVS